MLLLRKKVHIAGTNRCVSPPPLSLDVHAEKGSFVRSRSMEQDAEMMRLQILGDPALMAQLRQVRRDAMILPPHTLRSGNTCISDTGPSNAFYLAESKRELPTPERTSSATS